MKNYPLFQHAYFVNDVDEACKKWHSLFGAGPFVVTRHHVTDTFMYRGTDTEADVSYAFGYLDDMMIQFIQQHDDKPSIYRDMYAAGEEGFHHVGYLVNNWQAAKDRLEGLGFECACELYADRVSAAYYDTRSSTGGFTEIHMDPPHIISTFANWHRAHVNMEEGDGAFMDRPQIN